MDKQSCEVLNPKKSLEGRFSWFQLRIRSEPNYGYSKELSFSEGKVSLKRRKGIFSSVKYQVCLCRTLQQKADTSIFLQDVRLLIRLRKLVAARVTELAENQGFR